MSGEGSSVEALSNFEELMLEYESFDTAVRKRLKMMAGDWEQHTAFYVVPGAPATINLLEN